MPLVEIKPTDFFSQIHIRKRLKRGKQIYVITISQDLRDQYFDKERVKVFVDEENKLLGFQPTDDSNAYKFCEQQMSMARLTQYPIEPSKYDAEWSEKHNMLIAKVEFE